MYKTERSQRRFLGNVRMPKTDINEYLQIELDKQGNIKMIIHDRPTKAAISSFKFHARHGIHSGRVISNKWKAPKGVVLRAEKELIRLKKSKLSSKQRQIILNS